MKTSSINITLDQFEKLFQDFYPKVLAYANVILNDRREAEDIVQEVFLYVWERRDTLVASDAFQSYLFQSAYTKCLDRIKKDKRLEEYQRQSKIQLVEEYESYTQNDNQIIKNLYSADFTSKLQELLDKLPEVRKNVFILTYRDGLKAKEIAEKLSIPQRTVESHIYLSLKFLRKHFSPTDFLMIITSLCFFH